MQYEHSYTQLPEVQTVVISAPVAASNTKSSGPAPVASVTPEATRSPST
jgi:hypothetical protein